MSAYAAEPAPAMAPRGAQKLGAWVTAIGMASVIATSVCYAISPVETVMPVVPLDLTSAIAGARASAGMLGWISAIGIPGDMLSVAGCLALALFYQMRARQSVSIGWGIVGMSSLLFLIIDTIAGSVLRALARTGDAGGFAAIKLLFDQLFIAGVVTVAIGELFLAIPAFFRREDMPRPIAALLLANALLGLGSGAIAFGGGSVPRALGASVAFAAALLLIIAVGIIRHQHTKPMRSQV